MPVSHKSKKTRKHIKKMSGGSGRQPTNPNFESLKKKALKKLIYHIPQFSFSDLPADEDMHKILVELEVQRLTEDQKKNNNKTAREAREAALKIAKKKSKKKEEEYYKRILPIYWHYQYEKKNLRMGENLYNLDRKMETEMEYEYNDVYGNT